MFLDRTLINLKTYIYSVKGLKVIIIVGMPGSGKEEFVKVAVKFGFSVIRMGDIVREETQRRGLALTNENVGRVAQDMRDKFGYGIWAIRTLPKIKDKLTLIDGTRGDAEINIFKQNFGDAIEIVGIFTSAETRYERIRKRKKIDDVATLEEFYNRDQRELRWGIGNVFAMADYMIVNEGTLEELRKEAEKILTKIMKKD